MQEEREADAFAAAIVGPAAMIRFLRLLHSTRPPGGSGSWNAVGRRDLELRIAALNDGGT
jgi:hypothetical protein